MTRVPPLQPERLVIAVLSAVRLCLDPCSALPKTRRRGGQPGQPGWVSWWLSWEFARASAGVFFWKGAERLAVRGSMVAGAI